MTYTLSCLQNLVGNFRNLHQILQNLLSPRNLESGFICLKSMAWKVISRLRKELSGICSAIWNYSMQSMASKQIPDFGKAPLKGWVDSPARREVHHPPLGKFLGLKSGFETPSDGSDLLPARHQAAVIHQKSQPKKEADHG